MATELQGKKVAILLTNGFEQVEMTHPREALERAGATTELIAPKGDKVRGWDHTDWGDSFDVDVELGDADPAAYDALVLPGGVMNPDKLRLEPEAHAFARHFVEADKTLAAICHGPWTLIDAGLVEGRRMTSWPSLQTDLRNAGAQWVDEPCVVDGHLITSRNPDDLPRFSSAVVEALSG